MRTHPEARRVWSRGMVTTLFAMMLTGCSDCEDFLPPFDKPQETAPVTDPGTGTAAEDVEARSTPPPERSRAG